jgi:hypothetical protein
MMRKVAATMSDTETKMNPEVKAKWIAALESGEYKKGKLALRDKDDSFCCLGVLCDLYAKETGKGTWVLQNYNYKFDANTEEDTSLGRSSLYAPMQVAEWSGVDHVTGRALATINDATGTTTFDRVIARIKEL